MVGMFLWLTVGALALWFVVYRYKWRRMYKFAADLPSTGDELPLIGVAHHLAGNAEDIMTTMREFSYVAMKTGIAKAWLNHLLYIFVLDPVDMEVVLKTCLEKDDLHRFIQKIIGYGGIFAPVSIWRRRRKILVPAFSPKIVENFVEVFSEQSDQLASRLDARCGAERFSLWPFVSTYTLDSVCETALGVKINSQSNPDTPFLVSMTRALALVCLRIFHLWRQPDWLFKFLPEYKEHQECLSMMHSFTDNVIQRKREEITMENEKKTEADHHYNLGDYKKNTFLDLLIRFSGGENGYSNVELREEVLTLMIAGTDTSAVAIGYTMVLLSKYPDIQERLYEELYDVFGDSDRPVVKDDLPNLKYLERVVKESLRLYPPVPFIIRKVLHELKLPSGHVLPAGAGLLISIWGTHRNPKYWGPDAEQFDPDRFLPERLGQIHPCTYMPFSQGPRNCVGYQYALMSVKTALATIVRKFRIVGEAETTPTPHIRVKLDIMMKAVDGYQVNLEQRRPYTTSTKK